MESLLGVLCAILSYFDIEYWFSFLDRVLPLRAGKQKQLRKNSDELRGTLVNKGMVNKK